MDRRSSKAGHAHFVVAGQREALRRRPRPHAVDQLLQRAAPCVGLPPQGLDPLYLALGRGEALLKLGTLRA